MKAGHKHVCMSSEVEQALREARQMLQLAMCDVTSSGPVGSSSCASQMDQMEGPVPKAPAGDEPSSVRSRKRRGHGVPAHEVMAGASHEEHRELPRSQLEDPLDGFFLPGGGFGVASVGVSGAGSSYLDRRLLSYYLEGMAENTHDLATMDFYRGEEMWDGRYNYDHENRIESVLREAQDDRLYADKVASELRYTSDMYASDSFDRQRASDDYYRYHSQ